MGIVGTMRHPSCIFVIDHSVTGHTQSSSWRGQHGRWAHTTVVQFIYLFTYLNVYSAEKRVIINLLFCQNVHNHGDDELSAGHKWRSQAGLGTHNYICQLAAAECHRPGRQQRLL